MSKRQDDERTPTPSDSFLEASEIAADLAGLDANAPAMAEKALEWRERSARHRDETAFSLLHAGAKALVATLDYQTLLRQILDTVVHALEAERGAVFLGTGLQDDLIPAATCELDALEIGGLETVSRTLLARVMQSGSMRSSDASTDEFLRDAPSVRAQRLRSVLCVPLLSHGTFIGAVYVDRRSRTDAFSEPSLRFLEAFADLAASCLERARYHDEVVRENQQLRQIAPASGPFARIVTGDRWMRALLGQAETVAQVSAPVVITGESGTGKELLARALHYGGPRAQHPFLAQNCAAVPIDLMESLFFGHSVGAFTGAHRERSGLFQLADRGTLFLDEIADLVPGVQAKLLRVLETGVVRPLGSDVEVHVDVRLVTAASTALWDAVADGRFREDLYYRIAVVELRIPPLRERTGDLPLLIDHFTKLHERDVARRCRFLPNTLEHLMGLPWRGNVRELENLVRRALIFHPGGELRVKDVQALMGRRRDAARESPESVPVVDDGGGDTASSARFATLREREKQAILEALAKSGGNRTKAASLLGQQRNALLRKMKRLGI